MKIMLACLGVCLLLGSTQSFGQRFHDRAWGNYYGAYNCQVTDGKAAGCDSLHLWKVCHGYSGRTVFWGKYVALAIPADSPAEAGKWRGTLYIDDTCNDNQRDSLEAIFRRELAPYFGKNGLEVKSEVVTLKTVRDKGTMVYIPRVGKCDQPAVATANLAPFNKVWFMSSFTDKAPITMPSFGSLKRVNSIKEFFTIEDGLLPTPFLVTPTPFGVPPVPFPQKLRIPPMSEPYPPMKGTMLVGIVAPDWQRTPIERADWHDKKYRGFGVPSGTSFLGCFEFRGEVYPDKGM